MDPEFIPLLRTWVEEAQETLEEQGWTVELDGDTKAVSLVLEIGNLRGRLFLRDTGLLELGLLHLVTAQVRRGECEVFTEGQLEDAVRQFLEWFAEGDERAEDQMCPHGKYAYESRGFADEALRKIVKRPGMTSALGVYRCYMCGKWHIGGVNGRTGVRRRSFPS